VRKKRPCSVCRRWFLPDARVGGRQHACSAPACQQARHRRADQAWRARHADYDRARRWQAAIASAKAGRPVATPDRPAALAGVPWDVVQDEMKAEAVVIVAGVARVLTRHTQDEIRAQVAVMARDLAIVLPRVAQDEMEVAR